MLVATIHQPRPRNGAIDPRLLGSRLRAEVERLETELLGWASTTAPAPGSRLTGRGSAGPRPHELLRELRFLRQLCQAMNAAPPDGIRYDRAGFGSLVLARDVVSGRDRFYKLVSGPLDPLDAAQVALESPLGRALAGRRPHDEVHVDGRRHGARLRVVTLKTLPQRLRIPEPGA